MKKNLLFYPALWLASTMQPEFEPIPTARLSCDDDVPAIMATGLEQSKLQRIEFETAKQHRLVISAYAGHYATNGAYNAFEPGEIIAELANDQVVVAGQLSPNYRSFEKADEAITLLCGDRQLLGLSRLMDQD